MNHSTAGFWPFIAARGLARDIERLPMHVLRAAQSEVDHARADGGVGHAVDQDEAAHVAVVAYTDRTAIGLIEADVAHADLVELKHLGGEVLERVDVDLVLDAR